MIDLKADEGVDLSLAWEDELEHPVPAPEGVTPSWTVTDTAILNVVDNGDGTVFVVPTGELGQATVNMEATVDGRMVSGSESFTVVAGDAERVKLVAGTPREVTPDE